MNMKKLLNKRCLLEFILTSNMGYRNDDVLYYECIISYRVPIKFMGKVWFYKWIPVGRTICLYKELLESENISDIVKKLLSGREGVREMKLKRKLFKQEFDKL